MKEKIIPILYIIFIIVWVLLYQYMKINIWLYYGGLIISIVLVYLYLYRIEKKKREKRYNELSSRMMSRLNKDLLNNKP